MVIWYLLWSVQRPELSLFSFSIQNSENISLHQFHPMTITVTFAKVHFVQQQEMLSRKWNKNNTNALFNSRLFSNNIFFWSFFSLNCNCWCYSCGFKWCFLCSFIQLYHIFPRQTLMQKIKCKGNGQSDEMLSQMELRRVIIGTFFSCFFEWWWIEDGDSRKKDEGVDEL